VRPSNSDANRTENPPIDWNVIQWRQVNRTVRNLRQRIFRATQEGDWDKVQSLQRLMLRSTSNVAQSVRRVTQVNQGKNTPGVDKVLVKTPAERGKLVDYIVAHTTPWRAMPVKRVHIPKANGKQRPLGIPTMLDRALQAIVKNALEPSWEAKFEAISYGFRPGRSAQDAICQIWMIAKEKAKPWVLDADIRGCFDNINQEHLLETIGPFPARELIRQWLKAGYVEYGHLHETLTGTPQGGVISPLLANISLHGMETALGIHYRKGNERIGKCVVVRYADDFVVMCANEALAHQAQERLTEWLTVRGLQLSPEKTQIVHLSKGFDFLGFHIRIYPTRKTKSGWKALVTPGKKSVTKIREKLRQAWQSLEGHNVAAAIKCLNPIIRGWANYFRTQVSSATFSNLDTFMYNREFRYAQHLHPNKSKHWREAKYFGKLNPSRQDIWVFGDKDTGFYLAKFAWAGIQRHTMVTGRNSPDDPSLQDYWTKRELAKVKDLPPNPGRLAKRQRGKCPICGESLFIDENIEQHHIVPRVAGGSNHDDNKLLVHLYCHQQLTAHQRNVGYL
jgi:RNA-directed DNA polymerase